MPTLEGPSFFVPVRTPFAASSSLRFVNLRTWSQILLFPRLPSSPDMVHRHRIPATQGSDPWDLLARSIAALAARYAAALAGWSGGLTDELRGRLRALRSRCQDITELRRGDHSRARLELECERLRLDQEREREQLHALFQEWAGRSQVRDLVCVHWIPREARQRRLSEIFGLPTQPDAAPASPPAP